MYTNNSKINMKTPNVNTAIPAATAIFFFFFYCTFAQKKQKAIVGNRVTVSPTWFLRVCFYRRTLLLNCKGGMKYYE